MKRLVVKVGTNTLTGGGEGLSRIPMLGLARQVARLVREGHQVALVSSGAIVAGREALQIAQQGKASVIPFKQVLAAVGQAKLMQIWDQLFATEDMIVAQTLLTRADLEDRQGYLNARNTLLALMDRGVVPIVNENDVVATEEIKIGDNDNLSALVANLIDADMLILLTDQAGLFTADPRRSASATLIPEVPVITDAIVALAAGAGTVRGIGGMATKIQAARLATESGVSVLVASGTADNVLMSAVQGKATGTRFPSNRTKMESRKRWILSGLAGRSSAHIDAGAFTALKKGRSLLPAGIVDVKGRFDRGDSVNIVGPEGRPVACGVANYGAADLERIKGCRSAEIAKILGYHLGDEVIHRNNVVML
jgi:glutamate 5-kinase